MRRSFAVLVCGAMVVLPRVVHAQISGVVATSEGRPIAGVSIELIDAVKLHLVRTTGPDGLFTFDGTSGKRTLTARKIGFQPFSVIVERDAIRLAITLTPLPALLSEVAVQASAERSRDPCSRTPSTEATAIYARAAAFYRQDTRWLDRIARYAHESRLVAVDERETLSGVEQRGGWMRNAGKFDGPKMTNLTAVPRTFSAEMLTALPFPIPERNTSIYSAPKTGWVYPLFHATGAPSFVSLAFVDSMPKALVTKSAKGILLAFCPRNRQPPFASGEIQLGADSTIIAIRWQFTVTRPSEPAGGISFFSAPESKQVKAHLLPMNSIVWTHESKFNKFEVVEFSFGRWTVAESGDQIRAVPPPSY
jgi:hypothetical protein